MNENNVICVTCLSSDRSLIPLSKISGKIKFVNLYEVPPMGYICWECSGIVNKFYKFKLQTVEAQQLLLTRKNMRNSLSKLNVTTTTNFNYELEFDYDPLTNADTDKKSHVKTESVYEITDSIETSYNVANTVNAYVEKVECTTKIKGKKPKTVNKETSNNKCKTTSTLFNKVGKIKTINELTSRNKQKIDSHVYKENIKSIKKRKLKRKDKEDISINSSISKKITKSDIVKGILRKDNDRYSDDTEKEDNQVTNGCVQDFKDKFEEVKYSENELEKIREDKRKHYNFKKIPYKCDSCVLGFMRKENYDLHIVKKHDQTVGEYVCPVCQVRFACEASMNKHKSKHFVSYRCRLCSFETSELWSAVKHNKRKHKFDSNDKIHCAECEVVVKTGDELTEHMRLKHVLFCNECGEKFKGKHTLRTHMRRVHSAKRQHVCGVCSRTFVSKSRLESHLVSHDETLAKKLAFCTVCNVQYKNIFVYRNHLKNSANHTERLYPCPECDKKFASNVYRRQHYNFYHLRKSPYKCEACNKLLISKWRLKDHERKHHGSSRPRDHCCKTCGKRFYTLSSLHGHQLIHDPQRGYMCEECGDTFKQPAALYTHSRLVHRNAK
ncbi:zinc finger protein 718-like isoform X1 [Bombyx mandarina]|uniref:Zinc finger protein 718-like isoform X1 n=1 Tax=Bombyx mandarina TaxID=7092 RepID=A0A6J2K1X6_BOMMA|nr:zinc finger protein 718-like isoform X1 [Bombyx mandarina]